MRRLLFPFAVLYWCATYLRNRAYDIGVFASRRFNVPLICVGNITVGGTGKTPLIEYILSLLGNKSKVAVVSRGYRRQTKGQVVATADSEASEIGDEPRQLLSKYPETIVVVDADRAAAVDKAIALGASVVLMDDGMQHRNVEPSSIIMVCDYTRLPFGDMPLPAGNLRESWRQKRRAEVIVVNKCPLDMTPEQAERIRRRMRLLPHQYLFFSSIGYAPLKSFRSPSEAGLPQPDAHTPVLALAGIGRAEPFFDEVERRFCHVERMSFSDHHSFSVDDIRLVRKRLHVLGSDSVLVCTEKDAVRFDTNTNFRHDMFVLPIKISFLFGGEKMFNQIIRSYVR